MTNNGMKFYYLPALFQIDAITCDVKSTERNVLFKTILILPAINVGGQFFWGKILLNCNCFSEVIPGKAVWGGGGGIGHRWLGLTLRQSAFMRPKLKAAKFGSACREQQKDEALTFIHIFLFSCS